MKKKIGRILTEVACVVTAAVLCFGNVTGLTARADRIEAAQSQVSTNIDFAAENNITIGNDAEEESAAHEVSGSAEEESAAHEVSGNAEEESAAHEVSGSTNKKSDVFSYVPGDLHPFGDQTAYSYTRYNTENGLPFSHISALAQTKDGFIWIAGESGLLRFDGVDFKKFDPAVVGVHSVNCLCADSDGGLWVGSEEEGVSLLKNGTMQHWDIVSGLCSNDINSIIEVPDGIYAATDEGIMCWDRDMKMTVLDDRRINGQKIMSLSADEDGMIYGLSGDGEIMALNNKTIVRFYPAAEVKKIFPNGAADILPDKKRGYVYIPHTDGYDVCYCKLGETIEVQKTLEQRNNQGVNRIYEMYDNLLLCTTSGFGILDETIPWSMRSDPQINFKDAQCALLDSEGNIWIASGHQGVIKITPNLFANYDIFLSELAVYSVCVYEGFLLDATDIGLEFLDMEQSGSAWMQSVMVQENGIMDILYNEKTRDLIVDSKNRLWICSETDTELLCIEENKEIKKYSVKNGLLSNCVYTVYEMTDGAVAAATDKGVSVIRDGKVAESYGREAGIDLPDIMTVTEGFDGEIIAGSEDGGIYIIKDGKVKNITKNDGMMSDCVIKLKRDRFRDLIWIITRNSVAYMDEHCRITVVSNLPYANYYDIIQTEEDDMWMLGGMGITIARTKDLIDNKEDIFLRQCTGENGMPFGVTKNSRSFLSSNGDLFVAGSGGVCKINTKQIDKKNEYRFLIPYVEADGMRIYPDEHGNFHIHSNAEHIKVYPYLLNYSLLSPEISYCLEGADDGYITVSREDLGAVDYTKLEGGVYYFSVKIKDRLTGEETTENAYIFKDESFFELPWIRILNVILPMAAGYTLFITLFLIYKRYMKKRYEREVKEARVSSELEMSAKIQSSMLPDAKALFGEMKEFELAASMDPAKEVGGDFYDLSLLDPDHLYIVIADVSGKGAPAALFMMSSMITLSSCAERCLSPGEILTRANEKIVRNNDEDMFVSAWLGILEISTGKLTAASAGHEYPALMKPEGDFALFKDKHGSTLGWMEGTVYKEYELQLEPGAKIFVYTDGVPEATNKNEELFGTDRMIEVLNRAKDKTPDAIMKSVRSAVDEFVGDTEQFDDLTMVCMTYKGGKDHEKKQHDDRSKNGRA